MSDTTVVSHMQRVKQGPGELLYMCS